MKRRLVSLIAILILSVSMLSARSLELFDVPYSDGKILWPEVGRDAFDMDRGEFELEGPEDRWFEIELEGRERHHLFGSAESFLKRELNSILKDERKDAREDGENLKTLLSVSDDRHYHLTLEISDRFGVYYRSFLGLLLDSGAYYEFEAEYLEEDAFTVEKIEESILSLQ